MPQPPQHRADAPIVFIWSLDPAWDHERIVEEQKALRQAAKSGDEADRDRVKGHAYGMYIRGETRGDVTAPFADGESVEKYLDGTEVRIECNRLGLLELAQYRDRGGRTGQLAAAAAAYDGSIEKLAEEHGADFVFDLGEFVMRCSEAPRPGESKRSGF